MESSVVTALKHLRDLRNPMLVDLSDQDLEQLCGFIKNVKVEKGDLIIEEDENLDEVFFIAEGEMDIIKKEKDSSEYFRLRTQNPSENIVKIALLDSQPRSASLQRLKLLFY